MEPVSCTKTNRQLSHSLAILSLSMTTHHHIVEWANKETIAYVAGGHMMENIEKLLPPKSVVPLLTNRQAAAAGRGNMTRRRK